jgi:hypothetical protein
MTTGTAMRILLANATVFSASGCWRHAIGKTSMVANGRETKNPTARGNRPDSHAATPMTSADRTTLMTTAASTPLATYPLSMAPREMWTESSRRQSFLAHQT